MRMGHYWPVEASGHWTCIVTDYVAIPSVNYSLWDGKLDSDEWWIIMG